MSQTENYELKKEAYGGFYKLSEGEIEEQEKRGLLLKLEWPEEQIFDDGKQSNTLTGASHPGCCKQ